MRVDRHLCACGSGLRAARCCAMDLALAPLPEADRPLLPIVGRAVELHRDGAIAEAERLCLETLELVPAQLDALTVLLQIRSANGVESAVDALLRRIVTLYPNTFWAVNQLALALFNKGAILEAETYARNTVRIAPENPQSHYLMGNGADRGQPAPGR